MSKSKVNVTVIIPTFNEEKNILRCLETLGEQDFRDFEVIVVDDGSTDNTLSVMSNVKCQMSNVKLIQQKHQGPGVARNKAAGMARGEVLVFVDADMTFEKEFLGDLVRPVFDGIYKGTFSKEEYIANWENVWARCWNFNQNWPNKKMIPDDYPDWGKDFRAILKSEFLRVGGFDNTGYTDTWTLSEKLDYKPHSVKGARYFHANPDSLKEVFVQSKWSAKRPYKAGMIGTMLALFRSSMPVSMIVGVLQSIRYQEMRFVLFKVVYDLGAFIGILEMLIKGKLTK